MDKLKELFSGKGKYWMIGGLVLVVGLVFMSKRKGGSDTSVMSAPGIQNSGMSGLSRSDLSNAIEAYGKQDAENTKKQFEEYAKADAERTNKALTDITTGFNTVIEKTTAATGKQLDAITGALDKTTSAISTLNDRVTTQQSALSAQQHDMTQIFGGILNRLDNYQSSVETRLNQAVTAGQQKTSVVQPSTPNYYDSGAPTYGPPAPTPQPTQTTQKQTSTPAPSPVPTKENDSNQRAYLANVKSDPKSTQGQKDWANQALYLENVRATGSAGEKAWAEAELAKMY